MAVRYFRYIKLIQSPVFYRRDFFCFPENTKSFLFTPDSSGILVAAGIYAATRYNEWRERSS